jgi:hypothetical protein
LTEDIPLCGEKGSRFEIRAGFVGHLQIVQELSLVPE